MTNIYNDKAIEAYLNGMAEGDKELARLLVQCLRNPLLKDTRNDRSWLEEVYTVPIDAPEWLTEERLQASIAQGNPVVKFTPNADLDRRVRHIADWITAAISSHEKWLLEDVDIQEGVRRPRRFREIRTIDDATRMADADMAAAIAAIEARDPQKEGSIEIIEDLGDGYTMVRLCDSQALDRETLLMSHCIGGGAYDSKVVDKKYAYYSLRDSRNIPHATLEVRIPNNTLLQCKGEGIEGNPPDSQYLPYLKKFIEKRQYELVESTANTGLIKEGECYYDIHHLPEGLTITGNLDLEDSDITALPRRLHVGGNLYLFSTPITILPEGLHIGGNLNLQRTSIKALSKGLHVGGNLDLKDSDITALPEELHVGGDLNLAGTSIKALPERLHVGGGLYMYGIPIKALPKRLHVGGDLYLRDALITTLPEGLHIGGNLNLHGTPIKVLPEGLHIGGSLNLEGTPIKALPKNLHVGKGLYLHKTLITALPEGLHVSGGLDLSDTPITALPEGLYVDGSLNLAGTSIDASRQMFPRNITVVGRITMPDGSIIEPGSMRHQEINRSSSPPSLGQ